jgi:uncharacterized protein (DUF2235 family)
MKNIVVCCDGTANEFARNNTNVVKLFSTLVHDPAQQVVYYHPGLGTMEPPGALSTPAHRLTKLLARAFGYGLEADIRDTYVFLMTYFDAGDRLFMFGFSRGAYTVRAVASMLYMFGLLHRGNEALVPYAIRLMTARDRFALARPFASTFSSTACKPWFVGVWDTVASVGWIENPLRVPFSANNPDIHIGRQAVAIDERRAFFRANLWRPLPLPDAAGPKDLKQVWFPGVHRDVGGGYPERESGLSQLTLEWMLREARTAQLLLDDAKVAVVLGKRGGASDGTPIRITPPDPTAPLHESLTGWWRLAEFIPKQHYDWDTKTSRRRMNLFRRRTIPEHALIHESAYTRGNGYERRLPVTAVRVS